MGNCPVTTPPCYGVILAPMGESFLGEADVAKSKKPNKEETTTEDSDRSAKPNQIFENGGKDIPERAQSQTPDKNPGKVQPGHRDREQI